MSDNTLKTKKMIDNTLKKGEHYSSKTVYKESKSRMIKLGEWREVRLSLNKDLAN
jgi:hypothetical protein